MNLREDMNLESQNEWNAYGEACQDLRDLIIPKLDSLGKALWFERQMQHWKRKIEEEGYEPWDYLGYHVAWGSSVDSSDEDLELDLPGELSMRSFFTEMNHYLDESNSQDIPI